MMSHHNKIRAIAASALLTSVSLGASAQTSASPERFSPLASGYMERARTMLSEGNYGGVIDQLNMLRDNGTTLPPADEEQCVYMLAKAYYERGDSECVRLLHEFVARYPASPLARDARLSIGDYYFFRKMWPEALAEYSSIDFERLNRTQRPLYSYRLTLCRIKTGHYAEARESLKGFAGDSAYREAYTFYSAYLSYIDGDYDKAYSLFSKVKSRERGLDAAYYMTQIDFIRGEYEKTAAEGERLLRADMDPELAPELNRVTGISLFKLGDSSKARSFLERYMRTTPTEPAPDAVYALAATDYNDGDYASAAERFSTLTDLGNDIAQSAWLYLGQCDVIAGNDDAAAMAFEKAARMGCDKEVTETALYNYVAALTRGGKVPFSSSAGMLEDFIRRYPSSDYTPKVEEYLATAYYNERDYAKALASIEKIRKPSSSVLAAKQKVLYELGIEAMTNGRASEAVSYLGRSIELGSHDRTLAAQAQLWLGDAHYMLGQFKKAETAYNTFLKTEKNSANRTLALYNLGYAEYMQGNYTGAAREFAKSTAASPSLPPALRADALIRLADCRYYTGDYRSARTSYAEAIAAGAADSDYASYRHAVMTGLDGDIKGKLSELSEMQRNFPSSKWMPNALLEKALTYEALDRNDKAAEVFSELASSYPKSTQARKAMINLAITYSKAGNMERATETYKEIIRNWPSSEEASIANDDLRKYYASTGTLAEYAAFLRTVPEARQLDVDEMEQLAFDGAENAYADNASNITLLRNYVRDYPDGKYLAPALLDIAYSLRADGKAREAEEVLERLALARPHSVQYPEALLMRAEILENELPGRTDEAAEVYRELEKTGESDFLADAITGVARTTASPTERIEYARKARSSSGIQAEAADEMSLIEGEALIETGRVNEGTEILSSLAHNPAGLPGAKAAVTLASHYLAKGDFAAAEKLMLEFTEAGTPHQFQLAQGFIALADAYCGLGKEYLAKEYLVSLRDNYPGKEREILDAISSRLKKIGNKK